MANLNLPNPAQGSDQLAAIVQALSGASIPPPGVSVTPSPAGGSTTQTYVVVAKTNGALLPSAATSTTTGPTTLTSAAFNTITWNLSTTGLVGVTYDVYRKTGGATQGKIAASLSASVNTLVDGGLVGDGTTPPAFNTSGVLGLGVIDPVQVLVGTTDAITLPAGKVLINSSGVDATTLAVPLAGPASGGGQDGAVLQIVCLSAHAHTVTTGANGFNGSTHVATFTAAALNLITLLAYNGVWYVTGNVNATLS